MKGLSDTLLSRCAVVAVAAVLVLYPFSHTPLLPGIRISPLQAAACAVAVFGFVVFLMRLASAKKISADSAKQPLFWAIMSLLWLAASFVWGSRTVHELYYIGLIFVAFFFAVGLYALLRISKVSLDHIARIVLIAGVVLSFLAIWQFIGESVGLGRAYTSICPTCLQHDIGFARPSGFSQEPEHFSTILIGPIVVAAALLLKGVPRKQQRLLWLSVLIILTAFLLAASRSGLLALGFSLIAFSGLALRQSAQWFVVRLWGVFVAALCLALLLVAWSGTVGDKSGARYTVERYVAHSSGGLIVIGDEQQRLEEVETSLQQKAEISSGSEELNYITEATGYGPSGAIVYSAQSRLETYEMALSIWTENTKNFLIGVGWGNFGVTAHEREPTTFDKNTIVNNQYLQIAAELGLVGIILSALCVVQLGRFIYKATLDSRLKFAIFVLFGAYATQLLFYSGLHLLQFWLSAAIVAYILFIYDKKFRGKKAV